MRNWILGPVLTAAMAASAVVVTPVAAAAEPSGARPGRYIVTLKNTTARVAVHSFGAGRVVRTFSRFPASPRR